MWQPKTSHILTFAPGPLPQGVQPTSSPNLHGRKIAAMKEFEWFLQWVLSPAIDWHIRGAYLSPIRSEPRGSTPTDRRYHCQHATPVHESLCFLIDGNHLIIHRERRSIQNRLSSVMRARTTSVSWMCFRSTLRTLAPTIKFSHPFSSACALSACLTCSTVVVLPKLDKEGRQSWSDVGWFGSVVRAAANNRTFTLLSEAMEWNVDIILGVQYFWLAAWFETNTLLSAPCP